MKTEVAFLEAWRRKEKFYKERRTLDRISEMWTAEEWILPPHVFDLCNRLSVGTDPLNNLHESHIISDHPNSSPGWVLWTWAGLQLKVCVPAIWRQPALRKACVTHHHYHAMEWPLNWFLPDSTTPRLGRTRLARASRNYGISGRARTSMSRYNNWCLLMLSWHWTGAERDLVG